MFIKLTQVNRTTHTKIKGDLFVNPNSIHHIQTGFSINGVSATALAVTLSSTLFVTETPEQIMALIGGGGEPARTQFKVQTRSINGWADLKASVDGGPYEVELFDSHAAALADVGDELDPREFRIVPEGTEADDDLY